MTPRRSDGGVAIGIIAALGLLVIAGFWYFGGNLPKPRETALSLDGLAVWLDAGGAKARVFEGGRYLDRDRIGLAIVPLYDTRLDEEIDPPKDMEALLAQQDQTDIDAWVLREKRHSVPTLFVLPKWRSGMMLTGIAHPSLLNDAPRVQDLLRALTGRDGARLTRSAVTFGDIEAEGGRVAQIYLPQVMSRVPCSPVIGSAQSMLLGRCRVAGEDRGDEEEEIFYLLSDPDLLNAHGLRLGDNAVIARDILTGIAADKDIIIDYSTRNWVTRPGSIETRERTWADLARYFGPPFTALWIGFGVLTALVLWRASVRYGPVLRRFDDGLRAAKEVSIAARARLLRLSGHDGALLRAHAAARCQAVAAEIFGAHRRPGDAGTQVAAYAARRNPALGARLAAALSGIETMAERASVPEAVRGLDALERVLEEIRHDPGRPAQPR